MVILRFRVSLCCTLGSILSCIFGFYSDLPLPVPLVPVLAGPPNHGNTGFSQLKLCFLPLLPSGSSRLSPFARPLNHFTTVPMISVPSTVSIPQ